MHSPASQVWPGYRLLLAFALVFASTVPCAASATDTTDIRWHQIWLNGERVGSLKTERIEKDGQITHVETFAVTLARADTDVSISTVETHVESTSGKPISFSLKQKLGDSEAAVEASRRALEGKSPEPGWTMRQFDGKQWRQAALAIPKGAVLSEGADQLERAARTAGQSELRYTAFDPASLSAVPVQVRFGADERVVTPLGPRQGLRVEQTLTMNGASLLTVQWNSPDGHLIYARTPMLGTTLEVVASSEADATRPARGGDLFELTTVKPPQRLTRRQRNQDIDFWLVIEGDIPLPTLSGEQRSRQVAAADCALPADSQAHCIRLSIDLEPLRRTDRQAPTDTDRQSNNWVQSDDPRIREFARKVTAGEQDDQARMQALTRAVSARLADKNLSSAYASAREAYDDRAGDCTEHALLLAAAGRSLGIPTRVAAGLAYTDAFAGREHVMVPHAWVQAFVDGRWTSFDAALGNFDSGHILLATGNGDPGMYFGSLNALGNIRINRLKIHPHTP